ncbi:hypothetical protein K1W69_11245 [Hoeflea sp. WL0058]|uniref:MFS transporter n=1 Tax=Flavimaribacter sediminis TaxID=2865987 RepID=A0AAE3D1N8_9HYPH|nr:MFS transporter [Flavimaribacter sediminis]MBW8637763.1 hypothetical protein [Flavimaribacter sediminis]
MIGYLLANLFEALGASFLQLSLLWWVLEVADAGHLVGVLAACVIVPKYAGALITGLVVSRFGARRTLALSMFGASVGSIILFLLLVSGALNSVALIVCCLFTYGLIAPSIGAASSRAAVIARAARVRLSSMAAVSSVLMLSSYIIGLAGASAVIELLSLSGSVAVGSLFIVLSFLTIAMTFPRDGTPVKGKAEWPNWVASTHKSVAELHRLKVAGAMLIAAALIAGAQDAMVQVAMPLAASASGASPMALSAALSLCAVGTVGGSIAYRFVEGNVATERMIVLGALATLATSSAAMIHSGYETFVGAAVFATIVSSLLRTGVRVQLELGMPAPLKAHAIGLWRSVLFVATLLGYMCISLANAIPGLPPLAGAVFLLAAAILVALFRRSQMRVPLRRGV